MNEGNMIMTEKTTVDPMGAFSLTRDCLAAQQKFLPSGRIFAELAETVRTVTQAQIVFGQTVMRANAALLAALMEVPPPGTENPESTDRAERPSRAAHKPDVSAP
jgi:hypothetical protein